MSVSFIYHHHERDSASEIVQHVQEAGCECILAPLGLEVGSSEWQQQIEVDLQGSSVAVVLLSSDAVKDKWFKWRIKKASDMKKDLIPVIISEIERTLMPIELSYLQYVAMYNDEQKARALPMLIQVISAREATDKKRREAFASLNVFISYSRSDSDFVDKFVQDLRTNSIATWRDQDSIPKGTIWDAEIQKALNACTHVLLVVTPRSVESPNVMDEVGYALSKEKPVVPIILEKCELPLRIHRAQWIDFSQETSYSKSFDELLKYLK